MKKVTKAVLFFILLHLNSPLSLLDDKPKQSGKLWGKLLQATQTMAEKIPNRDEKGAGKMRTMKIGTSFYLIIISFFF
jgi:hypothetical protein